MLTPQLLLDQLQKEAINFFNLKNYMDHCLRISVNDGVFLEFGVQEGITLRYMAERTTKQVIGFDSFLGLPEEWNKANPAGTFSCQGKAPSDLPPNCYCVVGWFEDTLPAFLETFTQPISMVHLDADLYSSTIFVLRQLTSRLTRGVILNFNEFAGYPEWDQYEAKALADWLNETGKTVAPIGRTGGAYSQAAYRVLS